MKEDTLKTYSLEDLTDKHIGKRGTPARSQFNQALEMDILGDIVKRIRLDKKLTQEQLGELIGVKKAQISKIENNAKDLRLSTILRVFNALKAKVTLSIEFEKDPPVKLVN